MNKRILEAEAIFLREIEGQIDQVSSELLNSAPIYYFNGMTIDPKSAMSKLRQFVNQRGVYLFEVNLDWDQSAGDFLKKWSESQIENRPAINKKRISAQRIASPTCCKYLYLGSTQSLFHRLMEHICAIRIRALDKSEKIQTKNKTGSLRLRQFHDLHLEYEVEYSVRFVEINTEKSTTLNLIEGMLRNLVNPVIGKQ